MRLRVGAAAQALGLPVRHADDLGRPGAVLSHPPACLRIHLKFFQTLFPFLTLHVHTENFGIARGIYLVFSSRLCYPTDLVTD